MYWFIILFPLMIFPWGYDPYFTLPKTAYLELFVLAMWIYIILKRKYTSIVCKTSFKSPEFIIILFFCLIIISTVFSVNISTSLNGTRGRYEGVLTYFSYCSIFLFSYWLVDPKKMKALINGMAVVSILSSLYGILQHYFLDFIPRNSTKILDPRSYSFFDNANFFGSYLVLIMLLTTTLYIIEKNKRFTTFYFITIVLAFIALLFSQTRSGYVGVFVGLICITGFVIFKRRLLWKKWISLMGSLCIILILINLSENGQYFKRINTVATDAYSLVSDENNGGNQGSYRLLIWKNALPLTMEYFWHGSGPDTFEYVFPNNKEKKRIFGDMIVDKAHNEYLQMAITLGTPTLFVYLFLVMFILSRTLQAVQQAKNEEKIFLLGIISTIIGYLVQAFFNISVIPVAPLFWAILGITLAKAEVHISNDFGVKIVG